MPPPRAHGLYRAQGYAATFALALAVAGCNDGARSPRTGFVAQGIEDAGACAPAVTTPTQHLRRLSFDLRGGPPTRAELDEVARTGEVSPSVVDAMLSSEAFLEQVAAWHRASLWPNLAEFRVGGAQLGAWDPRDDDGTRGEWYSPESGLVGPNAAMHERGVVALGPIHGPMATLRGVVYPEAARCDGNLRYPDPAPAGSPQPTYRTRGTDGVERTYPYYDSDGVPLPFHDAAHCPNYCRAPGTDNYAAMDERGADASPHELDPPDRHCRGGYERVVNSCDRHPPVAGTPAEYFGHQIEGYRLVAHYWSAGRAIRTCAYEAQDREVSVEGRPCSSELTGYDHHHSCGCGPAGAYCAPSVPEYNTTASSRSLFNLRTALNEEPLRIVRDVVSRDESYFEVFRTRRAEVTGPLAFMYRNQADSVRASGGGRFSPPAARDAIPDLPYDDLTWHAYERGPLHAGVLTTAVYLLRFPTARARVSQFRSAFMCRPFTPATAALPPPGDACGREPDLSRRCGCQGCHAALEPLGAYWGRFVERSAEVLDPAQYPSLDPMCAACAMRWPPHPTDEEGLRLCSDRCRARYVIEQDRYPRQYHGRLASLLYRSEDEFRRAEDGPRAFVDAAVASGELASCTVRNAWGRLLNRPMTEREARTALPELLAQFTAARFSYRALVRAVVLSDAYRRVD